VSALRRWVAVAGLFALQILLPSPVEAAVAVGPVVISIPEGFETAQTQKLKKALITAWTKSARNSGLKTLLQINVIDLGVRPGKAPTTQELTVQAEHYLRQFLGGIERRRSGFASSPVAHIEIAGLPAARASWNGSVGGRDTVGVVYCMIVRNTFAVTLQTQDLGTTPSSGMFAAMRSIEAVTLATDRAGME